MEVMVRIDDTHSNHGWNWIRDRFLSMDKGTTRGLIGARLFNVQIRGRYGPEIAEFSPAGLDLGRVKHVCDLTPKKPRHWSAFVARRYGAQATALRINLRERWADAPGL